MVMNGIRENQKLESAQSVNQHGGTDQEKKKNCTKCKKTKPLSEFHKKPDMADNRSNQCKECARRRNRERYAINSEKVIKRTRAWYVANPKKVKKIQKRYRQGNLEKDIAKQNKRRVQKRNAGGSYTEEDIQKLLKQQNEVCNACGKKLIQYNKKNYHVDHIVPIVSGGTNWPENLQLLCPTCNLSKGDKHPIEWARENGRLF